MSEDKGMLVMDLIEKIKPFLAGQRPEIQGAVLADLLAMWLAGHTTEMRGDVLDVHLQGVIALIEANEMIMYGGKHPFDPMPTTN